MAHQNGIIDLQNTAAAGGGGSTAQTVYIHQTILQRELCVIGYTGTGGFFAQTLSVSGKGDHCAFYRKVGASAFGVNAANHAVVRDDADILCGGIGDITAIDRGIVALRP